MAEVEPVQAGEVREAVGVFMNTDALDHAVQDLLTAGFEIPDITLLARDETVEQKLGRRLSDTRSAADDPNVPRRSWASPEARMEGRGAVAGMLGYVGAVVTGAVTFATGGTALAAIALGVLAGGASAAAGSRLASAMDREMADSLHKQIEHGGILVWVKVRDDDDAEKAKRLLRQHGAEDVHVHRIALG